MRPCATPENLDPTRKSATPLELARLGAIRRGARAWDLAERRVLARLVLHHLDVIEQLHAVSHSDVLCVIGQTSPMRSVTIRAAVPFIGRGAAHEAHNTGGNAGRHGGCRYQVETPVGARAFRYPLLGD